MVRGLPGFFRVGLTGADSGSSFGAPSIRDSARADCDRSRSASPEYRLSLVLRSGKSPDLRLARLTSASSFTGYLMVNRPVDRRRWGHSPGHRASSEAAGLPLLSSLHSLGSDAGLPPPLLSGPARAVVGQSWRNGRTDQSPSWPSVKSPAQIPLAPGAWVSFSFVLLQSLWRLGARRVPAVPRASLSVTGCTCLFLLLSLLDWPETSHLFTHLPNVSSVLGTGQNDDPAQVPCL